MTLKPDDGAIKNPLKRVGFAYGFQKLVTDIRWHIHCYVDTITMCTKIHNMESNYTALLRIVNTFKRKFIRKNGNSWQRAKEESIYSSDTVDVCFL